VVLEGPGLGREGLAKLAFIFVDEVVFLEEAAEGVFCVVVGVAFLENFVVVGATGTVVEDLEGLVNLVESLFCLLPILLVAFRQPLVSKTFIGELDFQGRCAVGHSKDAVEVFHCHFAHLIRYYIPATDRTTQRSFYSFRRGDGGVGSAGGRVVEEGYNFIL
jgi:hypothetical protein